MKKSLRILVVLSIVASSLFFTPSANAVPSFDTTDVLVAVQNETYDVAWGPGNHWKIRANTDVTVTKVQVLMDLYFPGMGNGVHIYSDSSGVPSGLLGTLNLSSSPSPFTDGIATYTTSSPIALVSDTNYWLKIDAGAGSGLASGIPTYTGSAISVLFGGVMIRNFYGYELTGQAAYFAIFTSSPTAPPGAPTSVTATSTGKRSATVSFAAPASDGGSAITSYTAISTPGGITKTLTQATGGTFTFDALQPGTAYTFAVTATNAIGTSAAATSNSVTTIPLLVASISSLSFVDDGTGTGGKIIWAGKNIDSVLYTGPANSYPGSFNYGAFTTSWNGRIRYLTADTSYTVSILAISSDGVGESKSLTFKTSAPLPELAGGASSTVSRADELKAQIPKLFAWIDENIFLTGEPAILKKTLTRFASVSVLKRSAYLRLPYSSVVNVKAISSTPAICQVEAQLTVHAIAAGTCKISYSVTGASRDSVTMVRDFVFNKFTQ